MDNRLPIPSPILTEFCRRNHVQRPALFGSTQTGSQRPDSDIDLLVEFEPGCEPGFIALAGMELELSALLDGRPVDLRTPPDLSRYFRDEIFATAEVHCATHWSRTLGHSWPC